VHFCWWQLSAQAVKGTEPCTNKVKALDGAVETFGLMAGQDWLGSHSETITLLQAMTT
jgi:hypothetical protein